MFFYLDHHVDDENQLFKMFCHNKLCADGNCHQVKRTNDTAQININDSRMFHSFNEDAAKNLVNQGQFLGSFSVHVKQCSVRSMEPRNNEIEQCASRIQKHSMYRDVQFNEAANILPLFKLQPKQRHIEISTSSRYPNGLRHILSVTNSIFIIDENFVGCLTDPNYSLMTLEECQLLHCNKMTVVLTIENEITGLKGSI
jgi:hypothetical protein